MPPSESPAKRPIGGSLNCGLGLGRLRLGLLHLPAAVGCAGVAGAQAGVLHTDRERGAYPFAPSPSTFRCFSFSRRAPHISGAHLDGGQECAVVGGYGVVPSAARESVGHPGWLASSSL